MSTATQTSLPANPPKEFLSGMEKKYGPMAISGNALTVLSRRYLKKDNGGLETPEEMCARVAWNIALAEGLYGADEEGVAVVAERFYRIIHSLEFLPNSPTLMNAGKPLQQLSACFVLPIEDSMGSIFEGVKNTALIHQSGGGTGFSFSRLRPSGDTVKSTKGVSSGPISFMEVYNSATEAIKQGGTRRGANMGILRVDHPDILKFIHCKEDKGKLNNFNISIAVTDAFMKAVEDDGEYDLVNPRDGKKAGTLKAREVFEQIVLGAWRDGEPGVVFIDAMNRDNPTPKAGIFEATNPCGEQPLLPYESCNLGSINLGKMISLRSDGRVYLNLDRLREAVHTGVRFLDNVIDMNRYPLPEIDRVTKSNRKIGLGVMGLADMLAVLGVPYDSERGAAEGERVMRFIRKEAQEASCDLAGTRGSFPNFEDSVFPGTGWNAMRNATVTTIAPTGTISIIAGASSGIEPLFALAYVRTAMDKDKLVEANPLFLAAAKAGGFHSDALMGEVASRGTLHGVDGIPEDVRQAFRTAHDIAPEAHVRMQAAFQRHVDNAVSKTINFPSDATVEHVRTAYSAAFALGCKGITVYRDKSREDQVLSVGSTETKAAEVPVPETAREVSPRPRPATLVGATREVQTGCGALYVTVNSDEKGVFEIFNQMGKAGGCAASQSEAIGRLASLALRSGIKPETVVKQLRGISCHKPHGFGARCIHSCADAVGQALGAHLLAQQPAVQAVEAESVGIAPVGAKHSSGNIEVRGACPDCGAQVEMQEGCLKCRSCGFSEC